MKSLRARRVLSSVAVASLAITLSACGGGGATDQKAPGSKTKITITGQPPTTQPFERQIFDADVAEFKAAHPDIDIEPHEGFMDPKTFSAKLAGGQLEDVYYVY
jgi:multiple sugar transport system substrate-binding protein